MEFYIYWFSLALGLLIAEMATGTFYMLMLSVGCGAGGVAALVGMGLPLQMTLGAVVSVAGIFLLRNMKTNKTSQNLDIGQTVQIVIWREDGTARVRYRGAEWDAELDSTETSRENSLYIKKIHGSKLVLSNKP